jgi:hypothetical protein
VQSTLRVDCASRASGSQNSRSCTIASSAAPCTFPARVIDGVASVAIDVHELAVLLEGIEVDELKTKPRWEPAQSRSAMV